jgi:phenylpyruvate tautomerase PptA (4-oxalocrotonate tautomerase family)
VNALTRAASNLVAEQLGKPERYVMVRYAHNPDMLFAGNGDPLALLMLKSIGLPTEATSTLSSALCALMQAHLGITPERVYIEFTDAPRKMWGWNSGTF